MYVCQATWDKLSIRYSDITIAGMLGLAVIFYLFVCLSHQYQTIPLMIIIAVTHATDDEIRTQNVLDLITALYA